MPSEATTLERKLIAQIEREGKITFCAFMQAALYDQELGYYNTERLKIGAAGDYYTSSNVHPAFGAVLARAFAELWHELSDKQPLTLVEMGAGTGQLACDVMSALRDEHGSIFDGVNYVIVESSPAMRARQQQRLSEFGERVCWQTLSRIERNPIAGIFFSNELVDAMPVHLVRFTKDGIEEQHVVVEGNRLALVWDAPSSSRLIDYIRRTRLNFPEGQIIEINLEATVWLESVSRATARGFLVTIDYGDVAAHLYGADRARGTLRSFYRHTLVDSPLERIGEQDITASVNFTALIESGRDFGFETLSYERQTTFLIRNKLIERIAATAGDDVDDLKARLAVKNLFVPGGASDNFRVLIQKKLPA
ncbi:MAG: SAM-dependent methyltransferase [Blastocatellia bacterium]